MGELYEYIDTFDGDRVFIYCVIFILILFFFIKISIGLNILVAIIIGAFIISYLNHRFITNSYTQDKIVNIKKDAITPELFTESKERPDIVAFLFSIQDVYANNPLQYAEMVKYINYFYELYNLTFLEEKSCFINYGLMKQYKRDAVNSLMSIIFTISDNKQIREKINASAVILDDIMTLHLDRISYLVDNCIFKHGYDIDTKIIDYGPKAANEYDDMFKPYSNEIF